MKSYETPWLVGSLFICSKCGVVLEKPENAETLKSDLRGFLKNTNDHKNVRVMVSGCLSICDKTAQAVMYQPNNGKTELFTVSADYQQGLEQIKTVLQKKLNK